MPVWILGLFLAFPQDAIDEQIEEFEKYYHPRRSTAEKIEAIRVLEKCDRVSAATALLTAADDPLHPVRETVVDVLGEYRSGPVREYLTEVAVAKGNSFVRAVALEALGRAYSRQAIPEILPLLQERDFEVLRAAIVALGDLQAFEAIPPLIDLLGHEEDAVRTAALDTLGDFGKADECVEPVVGLLEDGAWQVRAAAMQALGKLRSVHSIQPLIDALRREEGRLRDDAVASLKALTGNDYYPDAELWQSWWDGIADRYELPSLDQLAAQAEARAKNQEKYELSKDGFVGIETSSQRIVFCIDVSGSMEEIIQDKSTFKLADRGFRSFQKMEIVKEELARSIEQLEPTTYFNILAFATDVKTFKRSLVPANNVNRSGAARWVRRLQPIGGASQGFRARSGLSAAGVMEGKTNTYAVLMQALEDSGRGTFDKHYGAKPPDTIFLLSDGSPTIGDYIDQRDILAEVRRVNELRKVAIHTIAIGEMDHEFMKQLAAENGGSFVDLGK